MKNPHIILLDGKLWAFDKPERPTICETVCETAGLDGQSCWCDTVTSQYNRAYSLALEQKLEVENYEEVFQIICGFPLRYKDNKPIYNDGKIKENEPIKWEGMVETVYQYKPDKNSFVSARKIVRLIAPVKEENSAMSYTEGSEADDPLSISGHIYRPPVPSEQEKHYSWNQFNLPSECVFQLQRIALADDEMVKQPGAAEVYRDIVRDILKSFTRK